MAFLSSVASNEAAVIGIPNLVLAPALDLRLLRTEKTAKNETGFFLFFHIVLVCDMESRISNL